MISRLASPPRGAQGSRAVGASPSAWLARLDRLWVLGVPLLAIALGSAVRIRQAISHRSLWLDELSVGLNITHSGYHQLARPLEYAQSAPILWLWGERFMLHLGSTQGPLCLPEVVAGCLTLVVVWDVGRLVLPRWLHPLPVIAVAAAPQLIYYSDQLKQYAVDALVVTLLLSVALRLQQGRCRQLKLWHAGSLAVLLAISSGVSDEGLLVGATLVGLLFVQRVALRQWRAAVLLGGAGIVDLAVIIWLYVASLRASSHNKVLEAFWKDGYPPKGASLGGDLHWLRSDLHALMKLPMHFTVLPSLGLALIALGALALVLSGKFDAAVVVVPLAANVVAALAHIFPLDGRLVLGLVPDVLVVASAAPMLVGRASHLASRHLWPQLRRSAAAPQHAARELPGTLVLGAVAGVVVLFGVVLAPDVAYAVRVVPHPITVEESQPLISYVAGHERPGDVVAVDYFAVEAWLFYAPHENVQAQATMHFADGRHCSPANPIGALDPGGHPFWVLTTHLYPTLVPDQLATIAERFEAVGGVVRTVVRPGAVLFHITFPSGVSPATGSIAADAGQCMTFAPPPMLAGTLGQG